MKKPKHPGVAFHWRHNPALKSVIRVSEPYDLEPRRIVDPFRALSRSIIYQQLSGASAKAIYNRFLTLGTGRHPKPEEVLAASLPELRKLGLSKQKASYLKDLAAAKLERRLPSPRQIRGMSDADLVSELTQVKGVGPWSVEMYMMFTLGRPDVWPVGDYGVQKGFSRIYLDGETLPTPAELMRAGEPWRPWRSVAAWYLWRALECQIGDQPKHLNKNG